MAKEECKLECAELGIEFTVDFDTVLYDTEEMEDICEMLASCIEAWHRRRSMVLANPKAYGFNIH